MSSFRNPRFISLSAGSVCSHVLISIFDSWKVKLRADVDASVDDSLFSLVLESVFINLQSAVRVFQFIVFFFLTFQPVLISGVMSINHILFFFLYNTAACVYLTCTSPRNTGHLTSPLFQPFQAQQTNRAKQVCGPRRSAWSNKCLVVVFIFGN